MFWTANFNLPIALSSKKINFGPGFLGMPRKRDHVGSSGGPVGKIKQDFPRGNSRSLLQRGLTSVLKTNLISRCVGSARENTSTIQCLFAGQRPTITFLSSALLSVKGLQNVLIDQTRQSWHHRCLGQCNLLDIESTKAGCFSNENVPLCPIYRLISISHGQRSSSVSRLPFSKPSLTMKPKIAQCNPISGPGPADLGKHTNVLQ